MKLLLKFFSNSSYSAYLRMLASELGESTNAIRIELNRLSSIGLLTSYKRDNTIWYSSNKEHPYFPELNRLVIKFMGLDSLINLVSEKTGKIDTAFIVGDYAKGIDSGVIDLVVVGKLLNKSYINRLVLKAENVCKRKIRMQALNTEEYDQSFDSQQLRKALIIIPFNKHSA